MPIEAVVQAFHKKLAEVQADAVLLFLRKDPQVPGWLREEEPAVAEKLAALIERGEVHGGEGNRVIVHALDRPYARLVTVGLGGKPLLRHMQDAFADMVRELRDRKVEKLAVVLPEACYPQARPAELAKALAEAAPISCYAYHKFMKTPEPTVKLSVELLSRSRDGLDQVAAGADRGFKVGSAVVRSRDLCNLPANYATPAYIADQAREIAAASHGLLKFTALGPEEMQAEGMNLILAVSQGSAEEPRLICLDYDGNPGSTRRIAVVGKSITFDSGGISLKPAKGMLEMKRDKMGGTNVLGLAEMAARLKPRLNLSFVVTAAENMPSGTAYRPGDCFQAMNGKWVEIVSTDAEGRLVLADALTWVQKHKKPSVILDMATLTGGAEMALGGGMIATFANDEALWAKLDGSARSSGEEIWRLPLYQPYKKGVKSYFAETKNSSTTPPSTIKAALFLEEWIDPGVAWGHLDIAASMTGNKPSGLTTRGASATGLKLVADVLALYESEGF